MTKTATKVGTKYLPQTFYDLTCANFELKRDTPIDAAVKLFAIGCQLSRVTDGE